MKTVQTILSTALYTSSILGIQILLMDKWLWDVAPTHAYGLIIFVIVDSVLLAAMWKGIVLATIGAALAATAQLSAMLADVTTGQSSGISASIFKTYLLSNTAFISLLTTQGVILVLALAALTRLHARQMR